MDNDNFLGRWLADDISEEEKKEFENSEDGLAYKDIIKGVEKFERPIFDIEKGLKNQKEFNKTYTATSETKVIKLKPWLYAAAATVLVLFGLKTFMFSSTNISTAMAESKKWTLPDSSIVTLNANSTIEYDEDSFAEDRIIKLEGEAFFDVAKGSKFTVKTNNGDITVLGTEFNVYSRNKTIEVHCYEGKVQVKNTQGAVAITAGKGVTSKENQPLSPTTTSDNGPNWIQGNSSFTKVKLTRLIAELERQYNIKIKKGDIDENRLFSGFFTHTDLYKALKTCFEPMNISYTFENSTTIELTNK